MRTCGPGAKKHPGVLDAPDAAKKQHSKFAKNARSIKCISALSHPHESGLKDWMHKANLLTAEWTWPFHECLCTVHANNVTARVQTTHRLLLKAYFANSLQVTELETGWLADASGAPTFWPVNLKNDGVGP